MTVKTVEATELVVTRQEIDSQRRSQSPGFDRAIDGSLF
jgi:hypothetical protein